MKIRIIVSVVCFSVVMLSSSCISNKDTVLLQRKKNQLIDSIYDYRYKRPRDYRVRAYDILRVNVYSLYPMLSKNITPIFGDNRFGDSGLGENRPYDVSKEGTIDMPLVGKLYVKGKTTKEIESLFSSEISQYFDIDKIHIRVTVEGVFNFIGEVNRQLPMGIRPLNLIEAIAMVGGLPLTADRKNIEIIRQYPEGTKSYYVDLTDAKLIESPYYWLQPNDIINIRALPQKTWGVGVTGYSIFTTITSTFTALVSLYFTYLSILK